MTKLPRRLVGESPAQSAIRKTRFSGPGVSLWLRDLCSHPAIWAGADRAQVDMSILSRSRWTGRPPRVDRCHLSSPDSSNHHAARKLVPAGWWEGVAVCVPGTSKASVPSGAEAGAVPPVGLEPTTFGLKVRSSDQLS